MKSLNGYSSNATRCQRNNVSTKAQAAALAASHREKAGARYWPTGRGGRGGSALTAPEAGRNISGIFFSVDKMPLSSSCAEGAGSGGGEASTEATGSDLISTGVSGSGWAGTCCTGSRAASAAGGVTFNPGFRRGPSHFATARQGAQSALRSAMLAGCTWRVTFWGTS